MPFGEIISVYTRKQAIEDGILVDVTQQSKEAGFNCSVCVTKGVWAVINEIPDNIKHQDAVGRLWDVLFMLRYLLAKKNATTIYFDVNMQHYIIFVEEGSKDKKVVSNLLSLYACAGPGDDGELVITVMLSHED